MQRIARKGWRQLALLVAMLLVFSYLAENLLRLQVFHSAAADSTMLGYYTQDIAAPQIQKPPRGIIVDANGRPLVGTVTVYKLAASPPYVKKKALTARTITDALFPLRLPTGKQAHNKKAIARAHAAYTRHYTQILHQLQASWSYVCLAGDDSPTCPAAFDISQQVKEVITARLNKLGLSGITTEPRYQPSYPNGGLAAQDLGFVTYKYQNGAWVDAGQYGVQEYYDGLLSGVPGHVSVRIDTNGLQMRLGAGADAAPQQGATLRLTLDSYIQLLIEQELAQVVHNSHAESGTIIVERPSDGAILAMASTPSYDPNNWRQIVNKRTKKGTLDSKSFGVFVNPAVSKQYEPGSTFKAFTVGIGLDSGSFTQYTPVNDPGKIKMDGFTLQNWCLDSCTFGGLEDPRKMLHFSSNIGAAQFSRLIPDTVWYDYLDRFGFGQLSGVDMAGEVRGDMRRPTGDNSGLVWVRAYKDTQAYGQAIAVTPLQLANAYGVFDNGGLLMRPHIVQSYSINGKTTTIQPQVIRRVISTSTADTMKHILVDQAVGGEGCYALVSGYDIAAKTGTASIPQYGGYASGQTVASTAAFGPVGDTDPTHQFVVLVAINKPYPQWGSLVAAPAVSQIFQQLFDYYKIPPSQNPVQPLKRCAFPGST